MPRYAKSNENRWLHPSYRRAFCFKYRNGMVYTSVDGHRQATGYVWDNKNRRICMDILNRRIYDENNKSQLKRSARTIKDLLIRFYRDYVIKFPHRNTRSGYRVTYRLFLNVDLNLADHIEIREHIRNVAIEQRANYSQNSMRKHMQRLRKLFNYAIENEMMEKNPIISTMIPAMTQGKVVICSEDEIKLLIDEFNKMGKPKEALLVEFLSLTALRIQEAINLQWDDIKDDYFIVRGKGARDRIFPYVFFPRVVEILNLLRQNNKPFPWKFTQTPTKKLCSLREKLSKSLNQNLDHIHFHSLRKSAINRWRQLGLDAETRNLLSGHTKDVEKDYYLVAPDLNFYKERLANLSRM
jgi:integrase